MEKLNKIKKLNEMNNSSFKNILIVTTTRDNLGSHIAFIEDINNIQDPEIDNDIKEMIINCLNGTSWEKNDLWVDGDMCGSDRGYIFGGNSTLFNNKLPVTIEHIINYVF